MPSTCDAFDKIMYDLCKLCIMRIRAKTGRIVTDIREVTIVPGTQTVTVVFHHVDGELPQTIEFEYNEI